MLTGFRLFADKRKFEILLVSLLILMFGIHPDFITSFLPIQIMIVGVVVFHDQKILFRIIASLLAFTVVISVCTDMMHIINDAVGRNLFSVAFIIFFFSITAEVFRRILKVKTVSAEIISAVLCGFIMLCFIGWFVYDIIETYTPGAFYGLDDSKMKTTNLLYFSVSNMLTFGYGDILPLSLLAKKSVMFMGILGHFYTVFITGIIIGKYVNQMDKK